MKKQILGVLIAAAFSVPALAEESVEVLHWWTSGGEAAALGVAGGHLLLGLGGGPVLGQVQQLADAGDDGGV